MLPIETNEQLDIMYKCVTINNTTLYDILQLNDAYTKSCLDGLYSVIYFHAQLMTGTPKFNELDNINRLLTLYKVYHDNPSTFFSHWGNFNCPEIQHSATKVRYNGDIVKLIFTRSVIIHYIDVAFRLYHDKRYEWSTLYGSLDSDELIAHPFNDFKTLFE